MSRFGLDWDKKITWRVLLALLSVLSVAWIAVSRVPAEAAAARHDRPPLPRSGYPAPDFTLETLAGEAVTLSDLQGQVVLINFWATWCPPCRAEMPAIQEVYEEYRDQGFTVLAVNERESQGRVATFMDELGLTFPVPLDRDGRVFRRYRVNALPSTFFVDREGIIRNVTIGGPMARTFIEGQISSLLAEGEG